MKIPLPWHQRPGLCRAVCAEEGTVQGRKVRALEISAQVFPRFSSRSLMDCLSQVKLKEKYCRVSVYLRAISELSENLPTSNSTQSTLHSIPTIRSELVEIKSLIHCPTSRALPFTFVTRTHCTVSLSLYMYMYMYNMVNGDTHHISLL